MRILETYNQDLPFPCYRCNQSFASDFDLEAHLLLIHKEIIIRGW